WLLGVRAGFGYDVISPDNAADISYLAWSFMPGIWFLPRVGAHPEVRWWVNFSPVLDYIREKQGSLQNTRFGGCFSLGAGTFLFASPRASFDVGLFFEGRFPDIDSDPSGQKLEISELRWLLRLGLSLWR